jgi:hypothetical protein
VLSSGELGAFVSTRLGLPHSHADERACSDGYLTAIPSTRHWLGPTPGWAHRMLRHWSLLDSRSAPEVALGYRLCRALWRSGAGWRGKRLPRPSQPMSWRSCWARGGGPLREPGPVGAKSMPSSQPGSAVRWRCLTAWPGLYRPAAGPTGVGLPSPPRPHDDNPERPQGDPHPADREEPVRGSR